MPTSRSLRRPWAFLPRIAFCRRSLRRALSRRRSRSGCARRGSPSSAVCREHAVRPPDRPPCFDGVRAQAVEKLVDDRLDPPGRTGRQHRDAERAPPCSRASHTARRGSAENGSLPASQTPDSSKARAPLLSIRCKPSTCESPVSCGVSAARRSIASRAAEAGAFEYAPRVRRSSPVPRSATGRQSSSRGMSRAISVGDDQVRTRQPATPAATPAARQRRSRRLGRDIAPATGSPETVAEWRFRPSSELATASLDDLQRRVELERRESFRLPRDASPSSSSRLSPAVCRCAERRHRAPIAAPFCRRRACRRCR